MLRRQQLVVPTSDVYPVCKNIILIYNESTGMYSLSSNKKSGEPQERKQKVHCYKSIALP